LFASKATVKVAADRGVVTVPRQLADVVNMIRDMGESDALSILCTARPARAQHPIVEGNTDDPGARDDGANLFIIKLALVRNQCATIVMAGEDQPSKAIHRFPKRFI
jgi:hypothetical protein